MESSDVVGFVFRAVAVLGEQIAKAISGGDIETVKELTKVLPEGVQLHAQALALKARQAQKAGT